MVKTMFASTLYADQWEGPRDTGKAIEKPELAKIENAIRALDGRQKTLVSLESEGPARMDIGGGNGGYYVVSATVDGQQFSTVTRPSKGQSTVRIIAGGQPGDYPADLAVDLDTALQAARAFAASGALDGSLRWEGRQSLGPSIRI